MNNKKHIKTLIFGTLYVLLILFFSYKCLETGTKSSESSNFVGTIIKNILNTLFNTHIEMTDSYTRLIRKLIGHFGFFLVLGSISIIFYLCLHRSLSFTLIYHYGIGLLFAFVSEFYFEALTDGRSASIKDVLIDYSGFISLSTIILLAYFFIKRRKKNEK